MVLAAEGCVNSFREARDREIAVLTRAERIERASLKRLTENTMLANDSGKWDGYLDYLSRTPDHFLHQCVNKPEIYATPDQTKP